MFLMQLLAYLGLLRVDGEKMSKLIVQRNSKLIAIFLMTERSHLKRKMIYSHLVHSWFFDITILDAIQKMVQKETIANLQFLVTEFKSKKSSIDPIHKPKVDQIRSAAQKRISRQKNLSDFRAGKLVGFKGKLLFDKSKMIRLEKVRQQLRKSMR